MEERHRSLTRRWIAANSLAETVGMTAAAAAAVAVDRFALATVAALAVLVAGGLVEGTALGLAQSRVLASRWPALRVRRYLLVTVLVAGLGWAAGSVPGVLDEGGGGASPPLPLVLLGAAGIGLVLGPLLGAAQALVLRGAVRRPWRWVLASAAAWPPAMAVIYLGATAPSASWPWPAVVALGALTGAAAGAVLGAVSAPWLRALDGPSVAGRVVLRLLESPARGALPGSSVCRSRAGVRVCPTACRCRPRPRQTPWWSCRVTRRPSSGGATSRAVRPCSCSTTVSGRSGARRCGVRDSPATPRRARPTGSAGPGSRSTAPSSCWSRRIGNAAITWRR